ncbi:MAG: tRNA (adenosine(37)-N6)-threonylcarbamoyltransferase complex dimerization subunit type 1 TsaB [Gemmatimonadota bacterium]|uniref:tRNA (adenosine(37)-N6)-threonylcarbamoyltransferase complex dimerization subunit type 1 TsaB n=1 Tax=Candidatus Palauibacter scopulicola TaxID=3056741 RepID=UPI002398BA01|nr:tRNA (adenosine(37)-N6)-threonylcarbamoyltransferase complex dimerization subunit type 1 TsaB [Candidatus Palauibacter scopulicola]MDE2663249.1 tRNA (adenosine(37)-N6)-threonylcarbamoyltransferase complex dimerization subunit type 1 TsaB [Candidatus Palauibacter scopulicola]
MLSLALETSTGLGGVALGRADNLISECALAVRATHSETVLDEVDRMLARARIGAEDIGRVVVGAGPGSFTGVRIAASLAKGWCHARGVPLFAYSSLRAVAASAGRDRVCALFDARRGEVYGAAFADGPLGAPVRGPAACDIGRWLGGLEDCASWSFAGEGAIRHRAMIEARGATVLPPFLGVPRAGALLWLAERLPAGRVADIDAWEPRYVRSSGAERQVGRRGGAGRQPVAKPRVSAESGGAPA